MKSLWDRFWTKVDKTGGCWVFSGASVDGYGCIYTGPGRGQTTLAHRVSYEWANGPVPTGLQLDHLCRNRACVNPAHLEAVTAAENVRRGDAAASLRNGEMCRNGLHPWPESGRECADGWVRCASCYRIRLDRRNSKRSAARESLAVLA